MHKQFSTVLPPFLMVFFWKSTLNQFLRTWGDLCTLLAKFQNHYIPQITFAKMPDWINFFGNWQYLKIMYNSDHKSNVIIRLRLNMNYLENEGCFKDLPLITCTFLAKSEFIPQVIFVKMPDWIQFLASDNIWKTCTIQIINRKWLLGSDWIWTFWKIEEFQGLGVDYMFSFSKISFHSSSYIC